MASLLKRLSFGVLGRYNYSALRENSKKTSHLFTQQYRCQICDRIAWERGKLATVLPRGLSYKCRGLSRSSGGWEDDITLV